jgi:hypothetical protein
LASIALWLFGVMDTGAQLVHVLLTGRPAADWVRLAAIGLSVAVTCLGSVGAKSWKTKTEAELRRQGKKAVEAVKGKDPAQLVNDDGVCRTLAELAKYDTTCIDTRLRYLSMISPEQISLLIGPDRGLWTAAQTVAYITDFPPEWLYDCAMSRRRAVGE